MKNFHKPKLVVYKKLGMKRIGLKRVQFNADKTSLPLLRGKAAGRASTLKAGVPLKRKRSTTIKDAQWSRAVKERDNFTCQWPGCRKYDKHNNAHHKALRSARPDLRFVVENGVTVCRYHHNWIHGAGRDEALRLGFLNLETYEAARRAA